MLKHIICKSALALALSLAVVGTAGAGDDYSKKDNDHKKHEQDKRHHDNKKHDDYADNDYDPSFDDPRMDNIKFDCAKSKKFPADNEKLCEKLGGDYLQVGNIKKCVIDKDPYRVTCKLPKKYPFEADITAATKVFIRVGNICVTKKLPGEIVACYNPHGKPVRVSKCEDKGCFPDDDQNDDHGHDGHGHDDYGHDDHGHDDHGRDRDHMAKY